MRPLLAFLLLAISIVGAGAQDSPKGTDILRQRMLIQQKFNKGWDERLETIRSEKVAAKCRAEAKKRYSAIRFKKRKSYEKNCIENARY